MTAAITELAQAELAWAIRQNSVPEFSPQGQPLRRDEVTLGNFLHAPRGEGQTGEPRWLTIVRSGETIAVESKSARPFRRHGMLLLEEFAATYEWVAELTAAARTDATTILVLGRGSDTRSSGAGHPDFYPLQTSERTLVDARTSISSIEMSERGGERAESKTLFSSGRLDDQTRTRALEVIEAFSQAPQLEPEQLYDLLGTFLETFGERGRALLELSLYASNISPGALSTLFMGVAQKAVESRRPSDFSILLRALNSNSPIWRYNAIDAISGVRSRSVQRALRERLAIESNRTVRAALAAALHQ